MTIFHERRFHSGTRCFQNFNSLDSELDAFICFIGSRDKLTAKFKFKLIAKQKNYFEERDEIGTNVKIFFEKINWLKNY